MGVHKRMGGVREKVRGQELSESRGGCPGLPSLISPRFLWP